MPRFYFHLNNSHDCIEDNEGRELNETARALEKGLEEARGLIAADVTRGQPIDLSSYVSIKDEAGNELGRVRYDEAVSFE